MVSVVLVSILFSVILAGCGSVVPPILLSTESGLHIYYKDNASITTIHKNLPGCPTPCTSSVSFRALGQDIYFVSGGIIWFTYFSQVTMQYAEPVQIVKDDTQVVKSLVVDWISYKLYFLNTSSQQIQQTTLWGTNRTTVGSPGTHLRLLAIDPYQKTLFLTDDGSLKLISLRDLVTNDDTDISNITRMAVDHRRHFLYVITATVEDTWTLLRVKYSYNSTSVVNTEVIYEGEELKQASSLDVFMDSVYWTATSPYEELMLFSCNVEFCKSTISLKTQLPFQTAVDMKIFHPLAQSPDNDYACLLLHCPYNCTELTRYSVQCVCPLYMTYDSSTNMCVEDPEFDWKGFLQSMTKGVSVLIASVSTYLNRLTLLIVLTLVWALCLLPCTQQPLAASAPRSARRKRKTSLEDISEIYETTQL